MPILDLASLIAARATKALPPTGIDQIFGVYQDKLTQSLQDVQYDNTKITETDLPPSEIDTYESTNDSPDPQTPTIGKSYQTTASISTSVTQGVSTTATAGATITTPVLGGSLSVQQNVSFSATDAQTTSVTQTWDGSLPIHIAPRSHMSVSWVVAMARFDVPFSGVMHILGIVTVVVHSIGGFRGNFDFGVGALFAKFPDPHVTVINNNEISVSVSGITTAAQGIKLSVNMKDTPLP